GVAEDVLHVEGEEEERRDEAGEADQRGDVRGGKTLHPEDRQRQARVVAALLVEDERGDQDEGCWEFASGARWARGDRGRGYQPEDKRQDARGRRGGPGTV